MKNLKMNNNLYSVSRVDNAKACKWTLITVGGCLFLKGMYGWAMAEIRYRYKVKEKRLDLESKPQADEVGTAHKIAEQPSPIPSESIATVEVDIRGCSSAELFKRSRSSVSASQWIVDGYMKVGLVNLLGAGAGVGKSILMSQIALAVSNGTRPEFLPQESNQSVKQRVIYYRLEDFSDELESKYGDGQAFGSSDITWFLPKDLPQLNHEGFITHLKALAGSLTEDTLVCVDPATKLDGYRHALFIKGVEEAMAIAKKRNVVLTLVAAVHLDEIKNWNELTNSDIKGGDKGLQQAGSVTALRKERTNVEVYRFLQSLKEPKGSPKPFKGEVLVCKVAETKQDSNEKYLHFQFDSIKPETKARPKKQKCESDISDDGANQHLAPNQKITPEMKEELVRLIAEGKTKKELADKYHVNVKTINNHLPPELKNTKQKSQ